MNGRHRGVNRYVRMWNKVKLRLRPIFQHSFFKYTPLIIVFISMALIITMGIRPAKAPTVDKPSSIYTREVESSRSVMRPELLSAFARKFVYVPKATVPPKKVVPPKPPKKANRGTSTTHAKKIRRIAPGLDFSRCSDSAGIESGLRYNARMLYRAVCNAFPAVGPFGGYRYDTDSLHYLGRAVDCMVSSHSEGERVKDFVMLHRKELKVMEVIWEQRIWTTTRPYWHWMSDRGSATANHYDHVHVSLLP